MATRGRRRGPGGGDEDERHREYEREHEPYDDPEEHLEIERRRFSGGLPPTPELYALAREQWYRLAGVLTRPSMDPVTGKPTSDDAQPPDQAHPGERKGGQ